MEVFSSYERLMTMNKMNIKSETLPQRCEICHQADCFDAQTNYCTRCGKAKGSYPIKKYSGHFLKIRRAVWFLLSIVIDLIIFDFKSARLTLLLFETEIFQKNRVAMICFLSFLFIFFSFIVFVVLLFLYALASSISY
jgi:hypothetical protein